MSKHTYFTQYNSPNIVIVPTKLLCDDPPQKLESEADRRTDSSAGDTNKSIPILIQGTTSNSETCTDMNAKNKSWASNYLQSIGLSYEKSIVNRRGRMNTSQDNELFLTQDPPPAAVGPHQFSDVNLQAVTPNIINYTNTNFPNYNNTASTTGATPDLTPCSYENNNYYYGQPMNTVKSGYCSTYYGSVENLPNAYLNPYGQPSNVGNITSSTVPYYNPNATLAPSANLPYPEFYSFNTQTIKNSGQSENISDNSKNTSITPSEDNRCPTPLIDENLLTPQIGTCINANISVTKLTDVKSCNMEETKLSSVSNSRIDEKKCDCMCAKRNPETQDKQNAEIQKISSVQTNEKAFRDFLRKLKIDRSFEQEKKQTSPSKSSTDSKKVKKRKAKSKEKSSVQENEQAFRKLLQKLKMERKSESEKSQYKRIIRKNTSSKDIKSYHEKAMTSSENKSSKDSKQKEAERPKFIKTKYVDEQEPEYKPIKKARLGNSYELEKYSKTKIITTKYVDEQEPDYKPLKKSGLDTHESKKYSTTKSQSTKYVDKQEPEYKPVKKQRNESDFDLKTYSNTKTLSTKYVNDKKNEYKQIKKTKTDSSCEFTKHNSTNLKIISSRDESGTLDKASKKYDSDYKIKTYKTESTKYYKYRNGDYEDPHKQTPVKSVVKISKTSELKKSPLYNILDKKDLRDRLSRKLPTKNKERKEEIFKSKSSEKSNDNLIITVNNNVSENKMSPVKITDKLKTKTETCKKINLVINIVYKQPGSRSESDKSDSDSHSPQGNTDLSFLDDFNVDEIVASLNKTEKISTPQTGTSNTTISGEETDPSNFFIKRENSEFETNMILEKGVVVNNLLSKGACILDSFRIIHEDIQNGKCSNLSNEHNKSLTGTQNKLPQKDNNCVADAQLKTDIKNETVFDQSINKNISPEKSVISKIIELEDTKKGEIKNFRVIQEQTNSTALTAQVLDIDSNDMHTYDITSFDNEDKRRQLELLKILEDTKDDEIEEIQTQSNSTPLTAEVSDVVTIIDLSSDDSNDSYKNKQSKENKLNDVYIVEEKLKNNIIETIDLTKAEILSSHILTPCLKTTEVLNIKENKRVSSTDVKENVLVDQQKTNNMLYERDMFSNEIIKKYVSGKNVLVKQVAVQDTDVCLDNSESKDTGTKMSTKTVRYLNRTEDKLNEDTTIEFPIINTIKETFYIPNNVKDKVSNIQDEINESQTDTQPSDKSIPICMEYENNTSRMLNKDCKQIQTVENCTSMKNSENIVSSGAEEEKHENERDHIKLKEDATMELPQSINTKNETISKLANNAKMEETVLLQAEGDDKNEQNSYTNMKIEKDVTKTSIVGCNTIQTIEKKDIQTISEIDRKQEEKDKKDSKNVGPQIIKSKTEVNIDEKMNSNEDGKSPKVKVLNKTEASTPMPSTSGTKINNPSPAIKKDKSNLKAVDMKVENVNKKPLTVSKDKQIPKIAGKIEREMYNCFNQNYIAQGLIHSGTFSKVFHFTSYSGRAYAVKSYNDWQSIYKYAEKKEMMLAMQDGLLRNDYGCVYLINSFSMQGHLGLLMDYYPKNLKQALEENEKPFHINGVQYLARQLVSAVMLLKSHDVVHLDIKPTHILLSYNNDKLKLCGFDAARYINKIPVLPNLGTVNYRPPEVIIGYKIGFDVDVWATAAVMYEMATDMQLFPGTQNNDILFKQMCTLGPLPVEMLHRSHFSPTHFTGSSFKRVMVYKQNEINIITKFYKTKRLETTIIKAYNRNWRSAATQQGLMADKKKILSFTALLREMLEVDPGDRMPIQFVNSHQFITDGF